jgi:hypothetical protein
MKSTTRHFIFFLLAELALCALVFLFVCDFFTAYSATAVSSDPYDVAETKVVQVHLFDETGTRFQRDWSVYWVKEAKLPVHSSPRTTSVNPDGPAVHKDRFTLSYQVNFSDGRVVTVPTTTPYALAMMLLFGGLGLFLRNMYISGHPLLIQKRRRVPVKKLAASGQPALSRRTKKSPPPGGSSSRRGRRR